MPRILVLIATSLLAAACSSSATSTGTSSSAPGTAASSASSASSSSAAAAAPAPAPSAAPVLADGWRRVHGASYEGVIVTEKADLASGFDQTVGAEVDGTWAVDDAAIARAEAGLSDALAKDPSTREVPPRLARYKRQYLGAVASGKKHIVINAFCSMDERWLTELVQVKGGGDCFFRVSFDVESGAYGKAVVNGPR